VKTVRLSTFSFDRLPSDHPWWAFAAAASLALALLAGVELLWRKHGARASYIESQQRWAYVREQLEKSKHPRRTAILGSSRILFDTSLDTFRARYPDVPVGQLAVPATGPLATLKSFAYDSSFDGVILFSFNPENLLPPRDNEQAGYVRYYRERWNLDHKLNFKIANVFEPFLVTRHDYYGLNRVARSLLSTRALPSSPLYLSVREDRQHDAHFADTDPMAMQETRIGAVIRRHDQLMKTVDAEWPRTMRALADAVGAIHARGGCVVFLRLPITARSLEQDQRIFVRPKYWDDVLRQLGVFGVHHEQLKGVSEIPLPDAEHIDAADQMRFTNALLDELDKLGVYDPARRCRP
jgi:hypothetical protein